MFLFLHELKLNILKWEVPELRSSWLQYPLKMIYKTIKRWKVSKKTLQQVGMYIGKWLGARKKRALFGHCHCLSVNNERGGDNVKLNVPSKKVLWWLPASLLPCLLAEGCVVVIRAADHNPILVVSSSIRDIDNHKKVRIRKCQTVDFIFRSFWGKKEAKKCRKGSYIGNYTLCALAVWLSSTTPKRNFI